MAMTPDRSLVNPIGTASSTGPTSPFVEVTDDLGNMGFYDFAELVNRNVPPSRRPASLPATPSSKPQKP